MSKKPSYNGLELAIIGMSCRMPAAKNPQEFWNNLTAGKECVQVLTAEEARAKGIPKSQIEDENFVLAQSEFPGKETFDAAFFGYRPDEASMMNPALRTFHECIWEALEDAGYDPQSINGSIGLFAGGGEDLNWRVYTKIINESQKVNDIALSMVSSKDYLTTVPSYKLDLRGPSMSIQTACSTSLVSVHMACKSLLMGESKLAIAGGISLLTDQTKGYFYEEGSIVSKDGHCRAFDQQANGTIRGEGAGLVVLKRLKEAIADKDHIYAIIKGGAINNDGLRKVGYTAPSIDGQAECIKAALRFSRVDPSSIGYVEAHGTGTKLGDPIEVKALNAAYGMGKGPASCPIGSVKTNIGHLDTAAGIAGLLKAALALKHKQIPPSLNFTAPNPAIPFDKGPFFVNDRLREWREGSNGPRRAAVSSLGLGGTNAHLILEEAPFQQPSKALSNKPTLLTLSAKSSASLQTYISRLKAHLLVNPETDLRDMTHSLQLGRRDFSHRFATTFGNREELLERLSATDLAQRIHPAGLAQKSAVFMFSGAGTQYVNMGKELYHSLPVFKETMDQGFQILESITNIDYRSIIYPEQDGDGRINEMLHTQPVLFLFEYATARLLMHFGVTPTYMIGHSLGEYAAACLSGIFSFEDALRLVVRRGELMDRMPAGAMLSVQLAESELAPYLNEDIALAAINGPNQSVLSGSVPAIETLMGRLEKDEQVFVRLHASIAGHSHMIDELLPDFEAALRQVNFGSLELPFVSGVSGTLIESKEACSVEYWLRHMRQTVRFANGIDHLLAQNPNLLFIETGSSNSLSILLREKWSNNQNRPTAVNLVRHPKETVEDEIYLSRQLGRLWQYGLSLDWSKLYEGEDRSRMPLPTYAFEPTVFPTAVNPAEILAGKLPALKDLVSSDPAEWIHAISWKKSFWLPTAVDHLQGHTLVFADDVWKEKLARSWKDRKDKIIWVYRGEQYQKISSGEYQINAAHFADLAQLFQQVQDDQQAISHILFGWTFEEEPQDHSLAHWKDIGYRCIVNIAKIFAEKFTAEKLQFDMIGNGWQSVTEEEVIHPAKSLTVGALKSVSREFENISIRIIDLPDASPLRLQALVQELEMTTDEQEIAIRGKSRYIKQFEKIGSQPLTSAPAFQKGGVYFITGATGGLGSLFAKQLAKKYQATLILSGRSERPEELLRELATEGASQVHYIQSDFTNQASISRQLKAIEEVVGPVTGVIHAAGKADLGGIILLRTQEDDEAVFHPKLEGTKLLYNIFQDHPLDFFVNFSSTAASLSSFGQAAYVAANVYQDAFAESVSDHFPMLSIEWNAVKDTGMAVTAMSHLTVEEQAEAMKFSIDRKEAWELLEKCISLKLPVQVIWRSDLNEAYRQNRELVKHLLTEKILEAEQASDVRNRLDRSAISANFKQAGSDTEEKLVAIYEQFFGLEGIGVEDSFFEIGGDSLKAMVLLQRIKKSFATELSLHDFFVARHISNIAQLLDEKIWLNQKSTKKYESII